MPNAVIPISTSQPIDSQLQIAPTRARQTDRPPKPFHDVLAGGVSLLLSGAEVATHVVAGPVMAAAVHDARVGATGALGASPGASASGNPGDVQSLVNDGQASNLQLLALQQQIQNDSQQFSTLSNVMRDRYDTAKAAVSNIRA
ncbi:MAG TPA: hypothetical protein VLT58_08625 [Polyangia bacterium]|nr:hypothetical protein [Polyangia bacterium]